MKLTELKVMVLAATVTFTVLNLQMILKLSQSVRGHVVTPNEVGMHLITSDPGHICIF